jgi:hypothetical protein
MKGGILRAVHLPNRICDLQLGSQHVGRDYVTEALVKSDAKPGCSVSASAMALKKPPQSYGRVIARTIRD